MKRGYSKDFQLHSDDIRAIEVLYGKKKRAITKPPNNQINKINKTNVEINKNKTTSVQTSTTTTKTSSTTRFKENSLPTIPTTQYHEKTSKTGSFYNSSLCLDGKFDAITVLSDNHTYIFKNDYVYRISKIFNYILICVIL